MLEDFDDIVFVLRENFCETIGGFNEIVDFRTGHVSSSTETEFLRVVNVCSETELAGSFTSNTDGITSQHLDGKTEVLGFVDGASSIVTGGIHTGHDTHDFPFRVTTSSCNTEGSETTRGELGNLVLVVVDNFIRKRVVFFDGLEDEKRGSLDTDDALTLWGFDNGGNLLGDGIERVEFDDLVFAENALGAGVVTESFQESLVNGIKTFGFAGSSETGRKHELIGIDTLDGVRLMKRQFVLRECTSPASLVLFETRIGGHLLIGTENFDTSKRFDSAELLYDGLLLSKISSTDSHGGGDDGGKTDGDTDDSDSQSKFE